jgi:hypothetical protein
VAFLSYSFCGVKVGDIRILAEYGQNYGVLWILMDICFPSRDHVR